MSNAMVEIYSWILVGMLGAMFLLYIVLIIYFNAKTGPKAVRIWVWNKMQGGGMRKELVEPDIEGFADIGDTVASADGTIIEKVPYAIDTSISHITEVYPDFPPWVGRRMPVSLHIRNHPAAITIDDVVTTQKNVKDTIMRTKAARNSMVLMTFMKISQRLLSRLQDKLFSTTNLLCFAIIIGLIYLGYVGNKQLESTQSLQKSIEALANMIATTPR